MKIQSVLNCQFHKWYPIFKKVTFKSKLYKLSPEFIDYLREDGMIVHEDYVNHNKDSKFSCKSPNSSFSDGHGAKKENYEEEKKDETQLEQSSKKRKFPDLEKQISEVAEEYDFLFIKLNWSSPKDSDGWVPNLRFKTITDVIYGLKASTFIQHDLNGWSEGCEDKEKCQESSIEYFLVMRKWYSMNYSMEFRCFVKQNVLIGISQRHTDCFFEFLLHNQEKIIQKVSSFFEENIKGKFFDDTFVFDVYIDIPPKERVWLVDFNPWGEKTDTLLFEWTDLESMGIDQGICYKVIEKSDLVQDKGLSQYKVPFELLGELEDGIKFEDIINNKHPELFQ